jgi:predicted secreted protein
MKKKLTFIIYLFFVGSNIFAQVIGKEIKRVNESGKSIFLVVTDNDSKGTDELVNIAEDAVRTVKNTTVLLLNRDDKANEGLISKYRLSGAPLPMIIVISSNGIACGGCNMNEATPEKLIKFIPTKKQEELLLAFSKGKAAFVVVSKKFMNDKSKVIDECNKACTQLKGLAVVINIDLDDTYEASFIKSLNIDNQITKTNIFIYNTKGQLNGRMEAPVQSKTLALTANKTASC